MMLLALSHDPTDLVVYIIIAVAVLSIAYLVITKVFGVPIPQWLIQVCGIVLGCVVAIIAIRFLVSL